MLLELQILDAGELYDQIKLQFEKDRHEASGRLVHGISENGHLLVFIQVDEISVESSDKYSSLATRK